MTVARDLGYTRLIRCDECGAVKRCPVGQALPIGWKERIPRGGQGTLTHACAACAGGGP